MRPSSLLPRSPSTRSSAWRALLVLAAACSPGQKTEPPTVVAPPPDDEATAGLNPDEPVDPSPTLQPTDSDVVLAQEPPPPFCGDGSLNDDEQCDDGGTEAGDGCSANCLVVAQGWVCPTPGALCERVELCGDALVLLSETCDDGNAEGGDGCSAACQVEADYVCPEPGEPCISLVVCGDGLLAGDETCDDGNTLDGDGCTAECQTEEGYQCPIRGALCVPACGDGLVVGLEQCDDANAASGDGCSATCSREPGFACPPQGGECTLTVCGDGVTEGDEGCDDGPNDRPFDGCFQCVREPACSQGECDAECGDGLRFDSEQCDDGNTLDGDGCSSDCQLVELGFVCADTAVGEVGASPTFELPVVYRDFIGIDTSGDGQEGARQTARAAAGVQLHPDFNVFQGTGVLGAVQATLGAGGVPLLNCAASPDPTLCNQNFTSAARFSEWYRDVAGVNLPIVDSLILGAQADGSFLFDSAVSTPQGEENPSAQFNPILGAGWTVPQPFDGAAPTIYEGQEFCAIDQLAGPGALGDPEGNARNMSFTTETRFVFEYQGGEEFQFSGDDDVWVFVNNRLIVDLGGLHEVATGNFTLAGNPAVATVVRNGPEGVASALDLEGSAQIQTGMQLGNVYEAVLFHAERHECGSNFKLTLAGFDKPRSQCNELCGDGEVTLSETCDDGEANGDGYGFCGADCRPGPRCGDGVLDPEFEECDNGFNLDRYSTSDGACAPECLLPAFCGDGQVNTAQGEACDDGAEENDGRYGGCNPDCSLGPRCGDGNQDADEECDDGNRINGDGCNLACEVERSVVPT